MQVFVERERERENRSNSYPLFKISLDCILGFMLTIYLRRCVFVWETADILTRVSKL